MDRVSSKLDLRHIPSISLSTCCIGNNLAALPFSRCFQKENEPLVDGLYKAQKNNYLNLPLLVSSYCETSVF